LNDQKLEPLSTEEWEEMVRLGGKREREPFTLEEQDRFDHLMKREGANLPEMDSGLTIGLMMVGLLSKYKKR
jgi:hypothetical protein